MVMIINLSCKSLNMARSCGNVVLCWIKSDPFCLCRSCYLTTDHTAGMTSGAPVERDQLQSLQNGSNLVQCSVTQKYTVQINNEHVHIFISACYRLNSYQRSINILTLVTYSGFVSLLKSLSSRSLSSAGKGCHKVHCLYIIFSSPNDIVQSESF